MVNTKIINWFESYLTEGSQCIKVSNRISQQLTTITDVSQVILEPLLVILYINDLTFGINETNHMTALLISSYYIRQT